MFSPSGKIINLERIKQRGIYVHIINNTVYFKRVPSRRKGVEYENFM